MLDQKAKSPLFPGAGEMTSALKARICVIFKLCQFPDLPVFVMSISEAEEYKKSTLTGANVPYNPRDPRQEHKDINKLETSDGSVFALALPNTQSL